MLDAIRDRQAMGRIGRAWDALARRSTPDHEAVDPTLLETMRRMQSLGERVRPDPDFADRLQAELMRSAGAALRRREPVRPVPASVRIDGGPASSGQRTWPSARPNRVAALGQWAAVAFVAIVAGGYLAILSRSIGDERSDDLPLVATTVTEPVVETLLDLTVPDLPPRRVVIEVNRWHVQPDSRAMPIPHADGLQLFSVEVGRIALAIDGQERVLSAGESVVVPPDQASAIRNPDATEAVVFYLPFSSSGQSENRYSDPTVVDWINLIPSYPTTALPGGTVRIVVERLTFPEGTALPPMEVTLLSWLGLGSGAVKLALEGDRLPYGWESGQERRLVAGQRLLPLDVAPGTRILLRNAGNDPATLYRLTITPTEPAE